MNKEDIIQMAQEAGMEFRENADEFNTAYCDGVHRDELERFAALVAAAEREACAKVLVDMFFPEDSDYHYIPDARGALKEAHVAIRARSKQ